MHDMFSTEVWVAIAGILVSIILSTYVVVSQSRTRTQKDFFIKEVDNLKTDYIGFSKNIRDGLQSAESIRDGFFNFSNRISMLDRFIGREYYLNRNLVFRRHGEFQTIITGFESIENQFRQPMVVLTPEERTRLDDALILVHEAMIDLIVSINQAKKPMPWFEE